MLRTFKRGVHPPENKLTADKPIIDLNPTGTFIFPMAQHIGAPATPAVAKGDRVTVGQVLGTASGFVSSPVLSSVSGTVKALKPVMTAAGLPSMAVEVESDGLFEECADLVRHSSVEELSAGDLREKIKNAGIVGMGGACFPTFIKLTPPEGAKIDTLIINAAECEPYLTCDYRLILEDIEPIKTGIKALLHLFPEAKLYVGIEDNKPQAIARMTEALDGFDPRVSVVSLKTKYPQGGEKQLIYAITGRSVPTGKLPADVGCIVCNTLTTYDIGCTVTLGRPSLKRVITLSGDCVAEPGNYRVPLGANLAEVVELAGGVKGTPQKALAGGPMMGATLHSLDVPVVKGTSGLLLLSEAALKSKPETSCIRCGRCVEACPMGLLPTDLDHLVRRGDYEGFKDLGGMNCIECGCCTYTCPAHRFLTQTCKEGKKFVTLAARRKQA